ncbi:MAG: PTS sugar transporter subunit IIA, partial [Treponemataceae bacterium]|nr:PTS sugar transporter subunit IIA [Treponemataceae bacterium]
GWACPHARVDFEEDLMCVIGWSPTGIDYGAPDGIPVSLIVMYLVPSNQRSHYLKEISMLAKVLKTVPSVDRLSSIKELSDVRNYLLDLIGESKETVGPDARARMIRLQAKAAMATQPISDLSQLIIEPVAIIVGNGMRPIALTQNVDLMNYIENTGGVTERLEAEGSYQNGGWRIIRWSTTAYQGGKIVFDCLAFMMGRGQS